jgi:hypothetical protein
MLRSEKVCKRDVPAKYNGTALFVAKPKCKSKKQTDWNIRTPLKTTVCGPERTHKDGKVVTKTTCGACDGTKKNISLEKSVKYKAKVVN